MIHAKQLYEKGILLNKKMLTQSQIADIQFTAHLSSIRTFYNVLRAINFVEVSKQ